VKRLLSCIIVFSALQYCFASVYDTPGHSNAIYEKDILVLKKILSSDEKNRIALERIIKMLFVCEKFDEAAGYSEKYLSNYKDPYIAYVRVISLASIGRHKEAAAAARLIADDPDLDVGQKALIRNKIDLFEKGIAANGVPAGAKKTEWGEGAYTAGIIDRERLLIGIYEKSGMPFVYSLANGSVQKNGEKLFLNGLDGLNTARILFISFSPDGREIFATVSDDKGLVSIKHRRFDIASEIWSDWSVPGFASAGTINGFANMLGDGEHLLFVSNRNSGSGLDIYVTKRDAAGSWGAPAQVINVNTPLDECSLYVHPDGETVYFSSNGRGGCGGYDLFAGSLSSVQDEFTIGNIVNLTKLNTYRNETLPLLVSAGADKAMYTFRKNNSDSIYHAAIYEKQPHPVLFLDCVVLDARDKSPVRAVVRLVRVGDRSSGITTTSGTDKKGRAPFAAWKKTRYTVEVTADGYAYHTETFETSGETETMVKTVYLEKGKVKTGYTFTAENLYYDTDRAHLRTESMPALERLYDFMKKNPGIKIEIAGYTDNVGGYSYNLDLSLRRAASVAEYLYGKGIAKDRITTKGYGYDRSVMPNDTEEGRQKNRRVEITVLSSD
jgi:outer membrane protein OmpA-like peptidoglycan-associated protein